MSFESKIPSAMKSILYELLPVHPAYAYKQLKSLQIIIFQTAKILSPKLVEGVSYLAKCTAQISLRFWVALTLWVIVWNLFIYIEFGSFFIIMSLFASIFLNLGEKKDGDLSAYSVFNKGFTTLLGQSTGQQFDKEIRHNNHDDFEDEDNHVREVRAEQKGSTEYADFTFLQTELLLPHLIFIRT